MKKNWIVAMLVPMLVAACHKKKILKPDELLQKVTPIVDKISEVVEEGRKAFEPNKDRKENALDFMKIVHFAYDSADLSDQARDQLASNVERLKENLDLNVLIEGHCDQRGTTAYNMALGERRAQAIESYYLRLGISQDRLHHVSYGEELPICEQETEECWAQNRRGETSKYH